MANPAFKKLEGIQQRIEQLQKEQTLAEHQVAQDLLAVLKALGAFQWEFETLVGALVETTQDLSKTDKKEALFEAGKSFLAKHRSVLGRARALVAESSGQS